MTAPLFAAEVHETEIPPELLTVACTALGASGALRGTTSFDGSEYALLPATLTAETST